MGRLEYLNKVHNYDLGASYSMFRHTNTDKTIQLQLYFVCSSYSRRILINCSFSFPPLSEFITYMLL